MLAPKPFKKRLPAIKVSQIIFWSVISAAFIGPGTITTALKAGAGFGVGLLWAVTFSVIACIVLQEAVARITIATHLTLGEVIQKKYGGKSFFNFNALITIAIVFGCVAYQAGNLTGALEGVRMITDLSKIYILLSIVVIAFALLWSGKIRRISEILGLLVVLMAILFAILAWQSGFRSEHIIVAAILPKIPSGSSLLIVGLIGTTIVPYNLFLGSGLSREKELNATRSGLIIAILIGGMITIFIILTGSMVQGIFSFEQVRDTVHMKVGSWGTVIFALGLFSAGFTSSVTAPLAAAITVRSGFNVQKNKMTKTFRLTWGIVLLTGAVVSLLNYNPVAIIIIAQVINGLILPFLGVSIFLILNDRFLIPSGYRNGSVYNGLTLLVVAATIFLGIYHIMDIFMLERNVMQFSWKNPIVISAMVTILSLIPLVIKGFLRKSGK